MENNWIANIIAVYLRATPSDVAYGRSWYRAANVFAKGLARQHGVSLAQAAGIIAVLSPRVNWGVNMALAEEWLEYGDVPTFYRTLDKLHAITAGGVDSGYMHDGKVFKRAIAGPKVYRFYLCILNPKRDDVIVVDRHALSIAMGQRLDDTGQKILERKGVYLQVERAYIEAALALGLQPLHLQATTWVTWRREHGVVDAYTEMEEF